MAALQKKPTEVQKPKITLSVSWLFKSSANVFDLTGKSSTCMAMLHKTTAQHLLLHEALQSQRSAASHNAVSSLVSAGSAKHWQKNAESNKPFTFPYNPENTALMKSKKVYNVEKIVDSRELNGRMQYLIKWEGYSSRHNTWEYDEDIYCKDLIAEYEASAANKHVSKKRKKTDSIDEKGPTKSPATDTTKKSPRKNKQEAFIDKGESDIESWEDSIEDVITVQWDTEKKHLLVQFKMKDGRVGVIPTSSAHNHFPRALLRFYERHIVFQSDSDTETHKASKL